MTLKNKRVLLSGATGYLGGRILRELIFAGNSVSVLVRPGSNLDKINEYNNIDFFYTDPEEVERAFRVKKFDCVVHSATCYGRSGESGLEIVESNLLFPLHILENACKNKVDYFINISTSLPKCINNYSLSKKQFEEWGKSYSRFKRIRFVNLLFEHFYGPGDSPHKFTSHVFNSLMKNVDELDLTTGLQKRDFLYIDDVVSAFMAIFNANSKTDEFFTEFEVGSGTAISIREFVENANRRSCCL